MGEAEIIRRIEVFCKDNPGAEFTFGHVVIADFNIEPHYIFDCFSIDNIMMWLTSSNNGDGHYLIETMRLYVKVADFLDELRELQENGISMRLGDSI